MRSGERIPWSVTDICETFKTSCLMGKHITNGDSANHSKDFLFRLVRWSKITQNFCYRLVATASVRSENLASNIPRLCLLRGDNLERRHILVADIEELGKMDASEIHACVNAPKR